MDSALPEDTARDIDRFLEDWRTDDDVPGLSAVVVERDGPVYATGLGDRDSETEAPATPETVYGVGSLAKPATALAVLRFAGRGDLALDAPVSEYLPVLADAPGEPITVGELLSHSSGLPRDFVAGHENVTGGEALFEHVDDAAPDRLTDRDRYMYSNSGYLLLGELLAELAGEPFHAVVADEVFEPLGMDRSTFDPDALDGFENVATGYRDDEDRSAADLREVEDAGSSGGLLTSASDLAALVRFVLNDGVHEGERLLPSDLFDAATARQSPALPSVDGIDRGYGYGWEVSELLGERLVGHRGSIYFAGGYVGALPERGLGVALAFNANGAGRGVVSAGKGVLALAAGEEPVDAVRMLGVNAKLDAVAGTYETRGGEQRVTVERAPVGRLSVTLEGRGMTFTATPESGDPEDLRFGATMGDGTRWPVEFFEEGEETVLVLSTAKWTSRLVET